MPRELDAFILIGSHSARLAAVYNLSFGPLDFDEIKEKVDEYYIETLGYEEGIEKEWLNTHLERHLMGDGLVRKENGKYVLDVTPLVVDLVRGLYDDGDFWGRVKIIDPSFFELLR
jgi:DNA-binding HxlR family transcriptional regulator